MERTQLECVEQEILVYLLGEGCHQAFTQELGIFIQVQRQALLDASHEMALHFGVGLSGIRSHSCLQPFPKAFLFPGVTDSLDLLFLRKQ